MCLTEEIIVKKMIKKYKIIIYVRVLVAFDTYVVGKIHKLDKRIGAI